MMGLIETIMTSAAIIALAGFAGAGFAIGFAVVVEVILRKQPDGRFVSIIISRVDKTSHRDPDA